MLVTKNAKITKYSADIEKLHSLRQFTYYMSHTKDGF